LFPVKPKQTIEERQAKCREYHAKHRAARIARARVYYQANRETLLAQKRHENVAKRHILRVRERAKQARYRKVPVLRLIHNLRKNIWWALKGLKKGRTLEMLGCTSLEFLTHLHAHFQEGMTLENYGRNGWHLEHHVPLKSIFDWTQAEHQRLAFNYRNTFPMWESDNIRKGNTLPPETLEHLESIAKAIGIDYEKHRAYFEAKFKAVAKIGSAA